MFIDLYKKNLGKSKNSQSLYQHSLDSLQIANKIFQKFKNFYPFYYNNKVDQILFSTFIHDIGKLDTNFQKMLEDIINNKKPSTITKHEKQTLQFHEILKESMDEIFMFIKNQIKWEITTEINIDIALAFALTHHGIYYLSFEKNNANIVRKVRREALTFYSNETKRITLTDLLFTYHPFGGLVIISDQIASYCHEEGKNFDQEFGHTTTFAQLLEKLIDVQGDLENIYQREKNPSININPMLKLLLGGIS